VEQSRVNLTGQSFFMPITPVYFLVTHEISSTTTKLSSLGYNSN